MVSYDAMPRDSPPPALFVSHSPLHRTQTHVAHLSFSSPIKQHLYLSPAPHVPPAHIQGKDDVSKPIEAVVKPEPEPAPYVYSFPLLLPTAITFTHRYRVENEFTIKLAQQKVSEVASPVVVSLRKKPATQANKAVATPTSASASATAATATPPPAGSTPSVPNSHAVSSNAQAGMHTKRHYSSSSLDQLCPNIVSQRYLHILLLLPPLHRMPPRHSPTFRPRLSSCHRTPPY